MTKAKDMKLIKVNPTVKSRLDNLAYEDETYNVTIQRILNEYDQLKEDKHNLMNIMLYSNNLSVFEDKIKYIEKKLNINSENKIEKLGENFEIPETLMKDPNKK